MRESVHLTGEGTHILRATFPNAVSSAAAKDSDGDDALDSYTIPFLAAGDYDLIIAGVSPDGSYGVVDDSTYTDIEVTADVTTQEDIDLTL